MPKYTVEFSAEPILRVEEDGEEIEFKGKVLRDKEEIATIEQRYGVALPDVEMASALRDQVDVIIRDDYEKIERDKTKDRARAIKTTLNMIEVDLP